MMHDHCWWSLVGIKVTKVRPKLFVFFFLNFHFTIIPLYRFLQIHVQLLLTPVWKANPLVMHSLVGSPRHPGSDPLLIETSGNGLGCSLNLKQCLTQDAYALGRHIFRHHTRWGEFVALRWMSLKIWNLSNLSQVWDDWRNQPKPLFPACSLLGSLYEKRGKIFEMATLSYSWLVITTMVSWPIFLILIEIAV